MPQKQKLPEESESTQPPKRGRAEHHGTHQSLREYDDLLVKLSNDRYLPAEIADILQEAPHHVSSATAT